MSLRTRTGRALVGAVLCGAAVAAPVPPSPSPLQLDVTEVAQLRQQGVAYDELALLGEQLLEVAPDGDAGCARPPSHSGPPTHAVAGPPQLVLGGAAPATGPAVASVLSRPAAQAALCRQFRTLEVEMAARQAALEQDPTLRPVLAAERASSAAFAEHVLEGVDRGRLQVDLEGRTAGTAAERAVRFALAQLGDPYRWGATGPDTFDCSGLTMQAYATAGVFLPRVSRQQFWAGTPVARHALLPGDLLFYARSTDDPGTIHHVAMYVGDELMVHAPRTGDVVRVAPVRDRGFAGATRPVPSVAAPPMPTVTPQPPSPASTAVPESASPTPSATPTPAPSTGPQSAATPAPTGSATPSPGPVETTTPTSPSPTPDEVEVPDDAPVDKTQAPSAAPDPHKTPAAATTPTPGKTPAPDMTRAPARTPGPNETQLPGTTPATDDAVVPNEVETPEAIEGPAVTTATRPRVTSPPIAVRPDDRTLKDRPLVTPQLEPRPTLPGQPRMLPSDRRRGVPSATP